MIKEGHIKDKGMVDATARLLTSTGFPWFWHRNQVYEDNPEKTSHGGLRHIYYHRGEENSNAFIIAKEILDTITLQENIVYKSIYRAQSNLLQNINILDEAIINSWHTDYDVPNHLVVLYYVITSDGNTIIKEGDNLVETTPVAGNYVIFDSTLLHRATMPKQNELRIVTNYVIEV